MKCNLDNKTFLFSTIKVVTEGGQENRSSRWIGALPPVTLSDKIKRVTNYDQADILPEEYAYNVILLGRNDVRG
jgi:hypothetical protein